MMYLEMVSQETTENETLIHINIFVIGGVLFLKLNVFSLIAGDLRSNAPFSNNSNILHKNIVFSKNSTKTNGTSNTDSSYLAENQQANNQHLDDITDGSYQSVYNKESDQMPNGNLSKEQSFQERNRIGKQSDNTINNETKNIPISNFNQCSLDPAYVLSHHKSIINLIITTIPY